MTKAGFAPKEVVLTSSLSGWYIGNILFDGLIGMLAVDPATGAMYNFPESVIGALEPATKTSAAPGQLTIVSTESLTPEQMARARLVASATPAR